MENVEELVRYARKVDEDVVEERRRQLVDEADAVCLLLLLGSK